MDRNPRGAHRTSPFAPYAAEDIIDRFPVRLIASDDRCTSGSEKLSNPPR
jgi:hypothetical protein